MDLAASVQVVLEEIVLRMARHVRKAVGVRSSGARGRRRAERRQRRATRVARTFPEIWVQPASGDAGGALGAALWMWHQQLGDPRVAPKPDAHAGAFLGTEIANASPDDDAILEKLGAVWDCEPEDALQERVARAIASGKVVALARGRTEFGPRSLGARSILGDARLPQMQSHMNLKIKFRESFRPFAPMVIAEDARDWFDTTQESPYMLLVYPVTERRRVPVDEGGLFGIDLLKASRSEIPAVTHVDHSARVQTVDTERNPFMAGVLRHYKAITGCPVVINTSFNVRGEPIVNTVEDAYRCFMATEIDCLVAGNRFLEREKQANRPLDDEQRASWLRRFELD